MRTTKFILLLGSLVLLITLFLAIVSKSSPVPEPASLALLGIGLLFSGGMMRRKRGVA